MLGTQQGSFTHSIHEECLASGVFGGFIYLFCWLVGDFLFSFSSCCWIGTGFFLFGFLFDLFHFACVLRPGPRYSG